jgi:hypothetical protein
MEVARQPGAFPLFCDGRRTSVVTADPWSFLHHIAARELSGANQKRSFAYLDQARDFYEAASNPRLGSKPLLYYYAFLNLAKFALVVRGVPLPQKIKHGISDPKANSKQQIKFSGQRVTWTGKAQDRSELFPEFLAMLSGKVVADGSASIKSLLKQIPTIQRTYCHITEEQNVFLPVHDVALLHANGQLWARVAVRRSDAKLEKLLERLEKRQSFSRLLTKVRSTNESEIWFETKSVPAVKKGMDNGIRALSKYLMPLGVSTILTGNGYRLYLSDIAPSMRLPQLAVVYGVMFYLGSITRYRPHEFERLIRGGESWLIGEYFSTQPNQFIHILCSFLAGRVVHKPYAV